MADVNANINIDIDTTSASAQLRALEAQLSEFNNRVIASNQKALAAQRQAINLLQSKIGDTGAFSSEIRTVDSSVSRFSKSLEKGKLSFGEYFRYGLASTKAFGRSFDQELSTIEGLAEDRVKRLSTRYVSLGQDINGAHRAMAISPKELSGGIDTQLALAAQKQQIFNKLLQQGSTHLVNWGKNTQWAGRQLMVGFTIPLTIFGGVAMKVFADLEKQTIAFQRVYGDLSTTISETDAMTDSVKGLASEFTKWGISVSDTMGMAAKAAATGAVGPALIAQTTQATRLATLGQMEQEDALKATIAMQNAFKMSNQEVADSVNFLNAVENQTVVSLQDISGAIPRVAPVIQGLGGDVKDLSVFLAAMQEGGVGAAEGANALKSGLASLINPTKQAKEGLHAVGIDIQAIIDTNRGDLMGTVTGFADALKDLDNTTKQQILAKVFGKYQFARLGALFENITTEGSQAARVMDLAGMSIQDLASLSERELGKIEDAVSVKFQASIEKLKLALAPIGEMFMKIATPIIDVATKILNVFNEMPDGVKTAVMIITALFAGIAPVFLMGVGLIANGLGNLVKGFSTLRGVYQKMVSAVNGGNNPLTQSFGYLSEAELDAIAAGQGLDGQLSKTTDKVLIQSHAVDGLASSYRSLISTMESMQAANPQGFSAPQAVRRGPRRMATGGEVGGTGNTDNQPALLMPGEFVVNKKAAEKYAPVLIAMNQGKLPGFANGTSGRFKPVIPTSQIPESGRAPLEFGHSAGFSAANLTSTVADLSAAADALEGDLSSTDRAFKDLLDRVLSAEKTFVRFEETSDRQWEATEIVTKALRELGTEAGAASLGQFGGGRVTSGTRNEALKQIEVDEPISFKDLKIASEKAAIALTEVANGTRNMGEPFQYALQGIIDEYNSLQGNLQGQSQYLLDNAEAMIRDGEMTGKKTSAEKAITIALQKRAAIEADLIATGAMLNGEIIDVTRAQQVLEAHLLEYARTVAISENQHVAKRGSMSQTSSSDAGDIRQPKMLEGERAKIFASPATRRKVSSDLAAEGIVVGKEWGIYLGKGFEDGLDISSPPPWSIQSGIWIAEGIQQGLKSVNLSTGNPANLSKSQMRGAVDISRPLAVDPQIAANLERLGFSAQKAAVATEKEAIVTVTNTIATEQEAVAHKQNVQAIEGESKGRRKGLGGMTSMLYAVDGLSMAMSFLPGPIGEFANKIFIASAALSALDAIIRIELVKGALKKFGTMLSGMAGGKLVGAMAGVKGAGSQVGLAAGGVAEAALSIKRKKLEGEAAAKATGSVGRFGKIIGTVAASVAGFGGWIVRMGKAIGPLIGNMFKLIGAVGKLAAAIPGIGWIIAAITTVATAFMYIGKYKNVGDQIRDMGNAAKFATEELQGIADKFGFTPKTSGFTQKQTALGNTQEARSVASEAAAYVKETDEMQQKVGVVKGASSVDAEAIFRGMFMDLINKGMPTDAAVALVEAVANEAGKQKIFVPIQAELSASIDDKGAIENVAKFIESNLNPSLKGLQGQIDQLTKTGFKGIIDRGAIDDAKKWTTIMDGVPDTIAAMIVPQYEQKKAILDTAASFDLFKTNSKTAMEALSSQFINGQIDVEKFNQGMTVIDSTLQKLPNNQGLEVLKQQLIELYPESESAISTINDAGDAFMIMQLEAMGVDMSGFIQQMSNAGWAAGVATQKLKDYLAAQTALSNTTTKIKEIEAQLEKEQAKPADTKGTPGTGGSSAQKDPFADRENALRDQQAAITIKEVKIDRNGEEKFLKDFESKFGSMEVVVEGVKIPIKSFEDVDYAMELIGQKIRNIEEGPLKGFQDKIEIINKSIDEEQKSLEAINHDITLQNNIIDSIRRSYGEILNPLEDQRQLHQDNLDVLNEQKDAQLRIIDDVIYGLQTELDTQQRLADAQNEAIDSQISGLDDQLKNIDEQEAALQRVADINQFIGDQQKRQISLSQALSQGDVYAAAQAAQELQAASVENAANKQAEAFKEQKNGIEDQKSGLEDQKTAIQDGLDAIQNQIDAQEYQKSLIEDSYRLRIRSEEDILNSTGKLITAAERERDAKIEPYQKIIDNYAPAIATMTESLYQKELAIKKVQEENIAPLEAQITALNNQKTIYDGFKADALLEIQRNKAQLARRKEYLDQELQILNAKREMANLDLGGGGGGGTAGTSGTRDDELIKKLKAELERLKAIERESRQEVPDRAVPIETNWYDGIISGAKSAWTGFTDWFIPNVIDPITNAWNSVYGAFDLNVIQPIKTGWNTLVTNIQAVGETFAALFTAIGQLFYENVIVPLKKKWDEWWELTIQPRLNDFAAWWESVRLKFGTFVEAIKLKWNEFWEDNIQPKIDSFILVWEIVKTKFTGFVDEIKKYWNDFWKDNIQPKIDTFLKLWDDVKNAFITAFTAIGTWWDDWKKETFDNKVTKMKEALASLFDADTWSGWMTSAMSAFKSIINQMIVAPLNSIELKIPSDIYGVPVPFIGGKSFKFDIQPLNKGGVAGDGNRDSVPAMLTPGEFIVRKSMVEKYGEPMFRSINQGSFASPTYNAPASRTSTINPINTNNTNINAPVYNTYSINIPVTQANVSADDIASKVMTKIKNIDNSSIRRISGY